MFKNQEMFTLIKMNAMIKKSCLYFHYLLEQAQHGFIAGRSTVTNMLTFDKYIGDCLMSIIIKC